MPALGDRYYIIQEPLLLASFDGSVLVGSLYDVLRLSPPRPQKFLDRKNPHLAHAGQKH
jgi:hypothetical protein